MSGNNTELMVNTRSNSAIGPPTMDSLQVAVNELKEAMIEVKDSMTGFFVNHN